MSERPPRWAHDGTVETGLPDPGRLAAMWLEELAFHRAHPEWAEREDADDDDEWEWISPSERLFELLRVDPEHAWKVILAIVERAGEEELVTVGAGPLEDLLHDHAAVFIARMEDEADRSMSFCKALRGAWACGIVPMPIHDRVDAAIRSGIRKHAGRTEA